MQSNLPPLLLVMIFLHALHSHYSDILDQFCSCHKVLEDARIELFVEDVKYHDGFQLANSVKKTPGPCGPKATTAKVDMKENEWSTLFEWLLSYGVKGTKTWWVRAMASMGMCPICHCF
jgi:hypothetical protein